MKLLKFFGNIIKSVPAILSFLSFSLFVFFEAIWYIRGMEYLYAPPEVYRRAYTAFAILSLLLVLLIFVTALAFKVKKTAIRIITTALLIISIPISSCLAAIRVICYVISPDCGYSYTEDITNYGKYDSKNTLSADFFPEAITEDMEVVNFSYYFNIGDAPNLDLYLEIRFESAEDMAKHLSDATEALSPNKIVEYENPFNKNYTDIMMWVTPQLINDNTVEFYAHNDFTYTYMFYDCISYSYDELTVIYNSTHITDDLSLGNVIDLNHYYPKLLVRFNVKFEAGYSFNTYAITKEALG